MIGNVLNEFAKWLGLTGLSALLVFLFVPLAIAIVQHYLEKRIDVRQDERIAKLQSDLDKTQKQLQTQLDIKSHVTRAQFDVEFGFYRQLWEKISQVKIESGIFVVVLERGIDSRDKKQAVEAQFQRFISANNACSKLIEDNVPFYAKSVSEPLRLLMTTYLNAAPIILDSLDNHKECLSNSQAISQEIHSRLTVVSEAIRDRLSQIVIIG